MSSIDDTEAAINAAVDGPPPEEPEVEEVESGTDDAAEVEAPLILGKFKTNEDVHKAYQELERQFTQQRQAPEPEPEPEEPPYNPLENFALGYDDADRQQIADSTMRVPEETLKWAMSEEVARFNPQLKHEVYQLWHSFAPMDAEAFNARLAIQGERQEIEALRNAWQQEQEVKRAETNQRSATDAFGMIHANLPDFDQYKGRVLELLTARDLADDDPRMQTPQAMADFIETLYARARWEEFKRQEQAAAEGQPENQSGKKARTQTRSTAAPAGGPMEDDQFRDEVLAGQPGRN